jgi:hypothetical protein
MDYLWWEMYNKGCGEGLTDVKSEGVDIERVQCTEHDTYTWIPVNALLWNLSFTQYISVYLYMI